LSIFYISSSSALIMHKNTTTEHFHFTCETNNPN
jgi:hypothetical protein